MMILVVDDNEQNVYQLQVLLGANGHQVVTAANGAEALAKALQAPPGLIISDILMPVMDGFALCREWKKDQKLRNVPFIFYTASYTDDRDRDFALGMGADEFIVKPMEPDLFLRKVQEVIRRAVNRPAMPRPVADETPDAEEARYLQKYTAALIRKLESKMTQLEKANRELEAHVVERVKTMNDLLFINAILSTQQEASIDGILVVDADGKIVSYNSRFSKMWGMPPGLVEAKNDGPVLRFVMGETKDPQSFLARVQYLYGHREETSRDEIALKDGRFFDRYSAPMFGTNGQYYGRVWYFRDISEHKGAEEALRASSEQTRNMLNGTVEAISSVLEVRDPYTAGHERRVSHLVCAMAAKLGWSEQQVEGVRIAGYMHDIGKVAVPSEILSKPGRITDFEMGIIQSHPRCGYDILKKISFPWPVALVALQHHERLDGSGYPQQLKGDQINPEARLLAIADVVEAMSSHRPYRAARSMDEALKEVTQKPHLYDHDMALVCQQLILEDGFNLT